MRIVSWNCNGAFRRKFNQISQLDADIYVVQECEDPNRCTQNGYREWSKDFLWIGDSKNKGLGIFSPKGITLEPLDWSSIYQDHEVKYFLPCLVNEDTQLLGVWTHRNNSPNFGYMGQFWKYLQINIDLFKKIIIAGDFNSNAIWDQWDRWWNHSDVVKILEERSIKSIYHLINKEVQGKESTPTFWLQKNIEKPYHIDYIFASNEFQKPIEFIIGNREKWIHLSDHVPIIYEV